TFHLVERRILLQLYFIFTSKQGECCRRIRFSQSDCFSFRVTFHHLVFRSIFPFAEILNRVDTTIDSPLELIKLAYTPFLPYRLLKSSLSWCQVSFVVFYRKESPMMVLVGHAREITTFFTVLKRFRHYHRNQN